MSTLCATKPDRQQGGTRSQSSEVLRGLGADLRGHRQKLGAITLDRATSAETSRRAIGGDQLSTSAP